MKIGITGHQQRDGIDWRWVEMCFRATMKSYTKIIGYSSLAVGTDQIFARSVLDMGGSLITAVPMENYEEYFEGESLHNYRSLLHDSIVVELNSKSPDEQAFLEAGQWIVRNVGTMIAVWDGEEAEGAGGTGDIVSYALSCKKLVTHINPISQKIRILE